MRYFGYGSNLNKRDLDNWCKTRNFNPLEMSNPEILKLENYEIAFTKRSSSRGDMGVADIVSRQGSFCYGVVFDVNDAEKKILDQKEGAPTFYRELELTDEIFTYDVVNKDADFIQPSNDYVNLIIEGAKNYGLPQSWIEKLESFKK